MHRIPSGSAGTIHFSQEGPSVLIVLHNQTGKNLTVTGCEQTNIDGQERREFHVELKATDG
jgi:hypothetical protein